MIETPLDTLNICRGIFVKSLVEDIGVFESASEYLEAYDSVNKLDLYYDKPYNEQALFRLAKAALEDSINTEGYTDDTMGYQDTGTPVQQPVQPQEEESQQPSVLHDTKSDLYINDGEAVILEPCAITHRGINESKTIKRLHLVIDFLDGYENKSAAVYQSLNNKQGWEN